jgi:hypothetical protein
MKIAFRLGLLVVVAALGCWVWMALFPSPETVVRRKMASLAKIATFNAGTSNLARAARAGNLADFFAHEAQINLAEPGQASRTLSGRAEIREAALGGFASLTALKVEFLDVTVRLGADKGGAEVRCTLRVQAADRQDFFVQEMRFQFQQVAGNWLITRAETVKTLTSRSWAAT